MIGFPTVTLWWTDLLKKRQAQERNNFVLFTGEAASGKSYAALKLCETLDKHFNAERVVFTPKEFFNQVIHLRSNSWMLFDEPSIALSHREWYKDINKIITWTLETMRYRLIHICFTAINKALLDRVAREFLIHFQGILVDRGKAEIYRVEPSQFEPGIVRTPHLGTWYFELPSLSLCEAYEEKRKQTQDMRYFTYLGDVTRKEAIHKPFDEVVRDAYTEIETLKVGDKVSVGKIMAKYGFGRNRAQVLKNLLEEGTG